MSIADYVAVAKEIGFGTPSSVADAAAALAGPPEDVADRLRSHHLLGFVQRAVREADAEARVSAELRCALASRRPIQRAAPEVLRDLFAEVRRTLADVGIDALLLKGLLLADRLYGGIDRRPQFDVDVLVRRRDLRRAARALVRAGFASEAYDLHSRTVIRDDVKVDVHGSLRWAPAYRLEEDALWADVREVAIAGTKVPTLSDEHTLVLLVLAAFEDLGQGTANLKQMLDVALFVRDVGPTTDWNVFLARRARENLLDPAVNVLALVLDVFAMAAAVPALAATLARHADRVEHRGREAALVLLGSAPKSAANLAWFARVYPGSMAAWLAWFWAGGFPENLGQLGRPWLAQALGVARGRLRPRRVGLS
jgi:hypothetical protein